MADEYTLPADDPCAPTLQAYQRYLTPLVDDYWQVTQYEAYAPDISRWQQCCPAGAVPRRPDKAVLPSLDDIPLPTMFGKDVPCARAIYWQGPFSGTGQGESWLHDYQRQQEKYWGQEYAAVRDRLHACCVDNFNACLQRPSGQGNPHVPSSAASSECLRRFSPDHQPLATATPAAAERAACTVRLNTARKTYAAELEQLNRQHAQAETELRQSAEQKGYLRPTPQKGKN